MTPGLVGIKGLAEFHGCHPDTARKQWRSWVRERGHPAPDGNKRPYRWRLAALEAWRLRAEAETAQRLIAPEPASNDNPSRPAGPRRAYAALAMGARI